MASHESFYTSQSPTRPLSQSQFPGSLPQPHAETPPPPPPKSISQEPSRRGTPFDNGRPLPATPFQGSDSPRPQPPLPTSNIGSSSPIPQSYPPEEPPIPPPSIESQWLPPSLHEHQTADLAPVLENQALLAAFAATHPSYASSLQPLTSALNANVDLSNRVLNLESRVSSLRSQTQQLLLQHTTLSTQWRRKQSEMDAALAPWGPRAMYQRLVAGIGEQEAVLRALEESFLEGGTDDGYGSLDLGSGGKASEREVNEWIRRIREGTVVLEKRREARGRWDEGRVGGWR